MPDLVDLRSDTVTRPTDGMRAAMARAEVGDDVYGEDPTVNALEDHVAELFGRDAALFVPSGSMANRIWLAVLAEPGTEVICEEYAHHVAFEAGAAAMLTGVQFHTLPGERGRLGADQVAAAIRPSMFPWARTAVVSLEQTTNYGGGSVYPLAQLEAIAEVAHAAGCRVHVDGARLFNASVAGGVPVADYAAVADGTSVCFSKALGAPIGSILIGDAADVAEARSWRHRFGGAMRQVGVLAAAARYALDHHVERLAEDHANARLIADVVSQAEPSAVDPSTVETNIVYVETGTRAASAVADDLRSDGVLVNAMGTNRLRLVTHLDVDEAGCRRAAERLARRLAS